MSVEYFVDHKTHKVEVNLATLRLGDVADLRQCCPSAHAPVLFIVV